MRKEAGERSRCAISRFLLISAVLSLYLLSTSAICCAYDVALNWEKNAETDVAGYKIYYSVDSSALPFTGTGLVEGPSPVDVRNQLTTAIHGLDSNRTYYIAVTAYNASGLESDYSQIQILPAVPLDTTAPHITAFAIPATSTSLTVPLTSFSVDDNVAVTGYLLAESTQPPAVDAAGWAAAAPASYTFSTAGFKSLYAWAKDAAGNVSNGAGRTVTITVPDTIAPKITAFTLPATATTLTVPVATFSATDNVGVESYCLSTSNSSANCAWLTSLPTSFTFSAAGTQTAYAWGRDAAGNISASKNATVKITLPTASTILKATGGRSKKWNLR